MERRFGSLLGVLVLLISALTMAGCPKTAVSSQGQTGYAVSFGIEGEPANGVLTAKIGEKELKNKESAPLGATVVFTARPNDGCKVKEWKVDGKIVNGTENTYSLKISKAVSVTVSFEKTSPPPSPTAKRKVTFSVEGTPANGTLKAMVGSTEIGSGAAVEQGKTVLFKAAPAQGFMVESWTGITPASPNAAEVRHTVTADITVKVTFKKIPSQTFSVTVQAEEHGKALVNPSLLEGNKAAKDTVLIFTATPDDGFVVDKWTIQGGSFEAGTGEDGNSTAKVKVTADVAVRVSFKAKPAGTVQYNVEHWQQNVTGNDYIKVDTEDKTGVTGAITEAQAKTYTGFRSLGIIQKPIAADGSTVVQIKYDRNLITLTLNLDGGGLTPPLPENKLKGRFGSDVPAVANPIKEGYVFSVWNPELPKKFPAENGTYTAQWAKEGDYTIIYHLDGDSYNTNPASYNVETATITLNPAIKRGYDFAGWYDNAACSGSPVTCIEKGSTGDREFWAKWEAVTYSITYHLNGGENDTGNPANYMEIETITLKPAVKTGYDFAGWYDNASYIGSPVMHIAKGSTDNKEFWAKWEAIPYTITYHLNGGKNHADNPANYTVETETIWLKDAEKKGYTFKGWYNNAACSGSPVTCIEKGSTDNKAFWAKWEIAIYTITYNLDGGKNHTDNPANYTVETETIWLKPAVKKGYTFEEWCEPFPGGYILWNQIEKGSTGNKTFRANWKIVTYGITYHLDGGKNHAYNPVNYTIETETITLKEAERTGYIFKGWYNNAACSGSPVTDIVRGSTGYKEFWAKWEAVTYSITYHLNGGSHSGNPASYNAEMGTITLEDASKANYTFKGWYDNAEFTGSPVTRIVKGSTGNKELWAKWEVISYTITYDLDGGKNHTDNPANYTIETETITLKPAVKKEYIFKGWYDNAEFTGSPVTCIEKGSTGNKTFWAKWKINEYMVTFSVEGEHGTLTAQSDGIAATADSPITVEHGKTVTFTAEPAGDYKVNKWTVTPAEALQTGGGGGKSITVKVSAATEVKVTFNPSFDKTYTIGDVSFTMKGIDAVTYERLGHSDESNNQPHTVSISAYRIGETEVTQELWQAVMGNNPSYFQGTSYPPENGEVQEKRPVEGVSWYECIAFCNELTKKAGFKAADCVYHVQGTVDIYTKAHAQAKKQPIQRLSRKGFRLPTEAEWEWAAKGGTEDKWAGTNDEDTLGNYAWCHKNSNQKTHQVKLKLPNGYGLYDMSGNVQEWCWDRAGELPDPLPADYEGYYDGYQRVFRGGSWHNSAFQAARAYREDYNSDCSYDHLGLRVACRP
ncbi:SUMF1/EgtB/PvdO family nonheme iron enzyme [Treponema sp. OMZ 305]|uniref:InlB B-repeat-containing protein n=1 Tax=Treponema sp. OMZ 305 TaxID=1659192 RepID=UPI0020A2CBBE|nr:InlB B-repeat-containing protein [Treponema sp. OMZ 305]UTC58037.1 SUMF1/EgtB/PvdO family nonheme iron enzyme [Treponema sp. OMZ 305]